MARDPDLKLDFEQTHLIIDLIRTFQHHWFPDYTAERISTQIRVAYCGRADVEPAKCVRFLQGTYSSHVDWMLFAPEITRQLVASSRAPRNAIRLAMEIASLIDRRVANIDPDDDKGFITRDFATTTIIKIANVLAGKAETLTDPIASRLTAARTLWAHAKRILQERERDLTRVGSLTAIVRSQLAATLAMDSAATAADVLMQSIREDLASLSFDSAVGEIIWKQPAPAIPQLEISLNSDLAMLLGVQLPLAVSTTAFKKNDRALGQQALELAVSIVNGQSPPYILRGHFKKIYEGLESLNGWKKFHSTTTVVRNMSKSLYDNLPVRRATRALTLVYYRYASVEKGDSTVRSFRNFNWRYEDDLTYARAVGLMREKGVPEALGFLQSVYPDDDKRRLHDKLVVALTQSGQFQRGIDLAPRRVRSRGRTTSESIVSSGSPSALPARTNIGLSVTFQTG